MSKKFIFILGGTRSGKSKYAVKLAEKLSDKVVYIATCTMPDKEMKKRIILHNASRPKYWKVIEEGIDISSVLTKFKAEYEVVLIDCLGLLISNLLSKKIKDAEIEAKLDTLSDTILKSKFTTILVSNEVGSGIVPLNSLSRRFRDIVGFANQIMAKKADEVIFMQSGIPIIIKREKGNAKNK